MRRTILNPFKSLCLSMILHVMPRHTTPPSTSPQLLSYLLPASHSLPRCAELEALLEGARCEIEVLEESVRQMIGGKAAVTGTKQLTLIHGERYLSAR